METDKLISRARNIILTPRMEWPVIAGESDTVAALYARYIVLLSAVPAVAGFLKSSVIGTHVPLIGTVRVGIMAGLTGMVMQYVIGLAVVYLLALIVNALAPTFGGQKDPMQALKTTAYASTASWLAGALVLVPLLGWLLALAGGIYSIYLLFLGLPSTMKCPQDKAVAYTAVTVICAVVMSLVLGAAIGAVTGFGALTGSSGSGLEIKSDRGTLKLDDFARRMEAAGKKMEEAQKSGDQQAQMQAAGQAMSAMLGGGDQVEALAPDRMKAFMPDTLDGLPRGDFSAERNTVMGVQVSTTRAVYRDEKGERSLDLEITDMGGAKGLTALAGWAAQEVDRQTDSGYEHIYHDGDRVIQEEWNKNTSHGSYGLILGQRFSVKLQGKAASMQELKDLVGGLNLSGLEALKKSGVKEPG